MGSTHVIIVNQSIHQRLIDGCVVLVGSEGNANQESVVLFVALLLCCCGGFLPAADDGRDAHTMSAIHGTAYFSGSTPFPPLPGGKTEGKWFYLQLSTCMNQASRVFIFYYWRSVFPPKSQEHTRSFEVGIVVVWGSAGGGGRYFLLFCRPCCEIS